MSKKQLTFDFSSQKQSNDPDLVERVENEPTPKRVPSGRVTQVYLNEVLSDDGLQLVYKGLWSLALPKYPLVRDNLIANLPRDPVIALMAGAWGRNRSELHRFGYPEAAQTLIYSGTKKLGITLTPSGIAEINPSSQYHHFNPSDQDPIINESWFSVLIRFGEQAAQDFMQSVSEPTPRNFWIPGGRRRPLSGNDRKKLTKSITSKLYL